MLNRWVRRAVRKTPEIAVRGLFDYAADHFVSDNDATRLSWVVRQVADRARRYGLPLRTIVAALESVTQELRKEAT